MTDRQYFVDGVSDIRMIAGVARVDFFAFGKAEPGAPHPHLPVVELVMTPQALTQAAMGLLRAAEALSRQQKTAATGKEAEPPAAGGEAAPSPPEASSPLAPPGSGQSPNF